MCCDQSIVGGTKTKVRFLVEIPASKSHTATKIFTGQVLNISDTQLALYLLNTDYVPAQ